MTSFSMLPGVLKPAAILRLDILRVFNPVDIVLPEIVKRGNPLFLRLNNEEVAFLPTERQCSTAA